MLDTVIKQYDHESLVLNHSDQTGRSVIQILGSFVRKLRSSDLTSRSNDQTSRNTKLTLRSKRVLSDVNRVPPVAAWTRARGPWVGKHLKRTRRPRMDDGKDANNTSSDAVHATGNGGQVPDDA